MHPNAHRFKARHVALALCCSVAALLALTGCLEQVQTTRLPSGALSNFLLHLQQGELDDARSYIAPGLVTPSAELDASIKEASDKLRAYEIADKKARNEKLDDGQLRETIAGRVRPRTAAGEPTPGPDEGWKQTDIIMARMVERGPGW